MNNKYRLFGKIPVVDILVVILLAAALAAGTWLLTRRDVKEQTGTVSQDDSAPFTATFLINNVDSGSAALVQTGDELFLADGTPIGTVTEFKTEPYVRYAPSPALGKQVGTVMNGRSNVIISAKCTATSCTKRGIFVKKKRVALNYNLPIGNKKYQFTGLVIALDTEVQL